MQPSAPPPHHLARASTPFFTLGSVAEDKAKFTRFMNTVADTYPPEVAGDGVRSLGTTLTSIKMAHYFLLAGDLPLL